MLADAGVEQLAVEVRQPARRQRLWGAAVPLRLPAVGEVLQQHGDEGRGDPVAGDVRKLEQQVALAEALEVEEVAGEVEPGSEPVVAGDAPGGLGPRRQQLALDLTAGLLVQAQHGQVGLQALVELLQAYLVLATRLLQLAQLDYLADHAPQQDRKSVV